MYVPRIDNDGRVIFMGRRSTGLGFCGIAAFLYATRYITAAIFGSGVSSWNSDLFHALLQYVGNSLTILSVISLIVGISYLVMGEIRK
jgi:hypothetical protein